jgi:hypothetical protein
MLSQQAVGVGQVDGHQLLQSSRLLLLHNRTPLRRPEVSYWRIDGRCCGSMLS